MSEAKLPRQHAYENATTSGVCKLGFEAFKGPLYAILNMIGPSEGTLGEGDFTPAAGYHHILLIDVQAFHVHDWNPFSWVVVQPQDVVGILCLPVMEVLSWLREQPECVGLDGQFRRSAVESWVRTNLEAVTSWLDQNAEERPVAFANTLGTLAGQPPIRSQS